MKELIAELVGGLSLLLAPIVWLLMMGGILHLGWLLFTSVFG
jgi:hypothetical protein